MAKLVSKTYGDALFELALEEGRQDLFLEEALGIKKVLNENDDFVKMMNHPQISEERRKTLLRMFLKAGFPMI